jgi:hypothetical protein
VEGCLERIDPTRTPSRATNQVDAAALHFAPIRPNCGAEPLTKSGRKFETKYLARQVGLEQIILKLTGNLSYGRRVQVGNRFHLLMVLRVLPGMSARFGRFALFHCQPHWPHR